ncbi:hypothetical protein CVT26_008580 [Gymnopilus dilepis]|uniref:Uncharacterized protein n=1 Tax=Gymnopilus dilepis TaxID=231916 RepID=A0A409WCH6_9AGAR|nr:hypothetical protein CVT26_008580 [Gymnopilus dilepis]
MLKDDFKDGSGTAFVSGPIEAPDNFFADHYEPLLMKAISLGHSFVMGPASGTDSTALKYLIDQGVEPSRITVYLTKFEEKVLKDRIEWFIKLGGNFEVEGTTTSERDAAMTRDSDYDILRYMTIEEQKVFYGERYFPRVSATEKNDRRRRGLPLHVNHGLVDQDNQREHRTVADKTGKSGTQKPGPLKRLLGGY